MSASQKFQREVNGIKFSKSPDDSTTFSVGDYVLISYPTGPPDKLMSMWRGPYIVSEVNNQKYYCRDLINNRTLALFVDRLKKYHADNSIDPKELSMADKDEFYVEKIVDHRDDFCR